MKIKFELDASDFTLGGWKKIFEMCNNGASNVVVYFNEMNPSTNKKISLAIGCQGILYMVVYPREYSRTWSYLSEVYCYENDCFKLSICPHSSIGY